MTIPIWLAMLWSLLLLGLFLRVVFVPLRLPATAGRALLLVLAVALGVRLLPNLLLPVGAGYDIDSYAIVGETLLQGADVYTSEAAAPRYPYLPFQMLWSAAARWLSLALDLPFVKVVRLMPIVADAAIAALLFAWLRRRGEGVEAGARAGLLYALNPLAIFVSSYHGQFDALPLLLLLLALYAAPRTALGAGGWLGLGILAKGWPVLAAPALLFGLPAWAGRARFLAAMLLVPLAGVLLYALALDAAVGPILTRALSYNWGVGIWGYSYFFRLAAVLDPANRPLFQWVVANGRYLTLAALALVWLLRARREAPLQATFTIFLAFLALTHAFSIQYLVWLVPLAILVEQPRWLARYTIGAFAYMFLAYSTLILQSTITQLLPWPAADHFLIMPAALPAWLVTLGWMRAHLARPLHHDSLS